MERQANRADGHIEAAAPRDSLSLEEMQSAAVLLVYVFYSLHCSFAELQSFVAAIQPKAVHGIVTAWVARRDGSKERSRDPACHFSPRLMH